MLSLNFSKEKNTLLENVGEDWINEMKQILGDSSIQNVILRHEGITEIGYLNNPSTGSRPEPIESLTRCKLNFSTHAN